MSAAFRQQLDRRYGISNPRFQRALPGRVETEAQAFTANILAAALAVPAALAKPPLSIRALNNMTYGATATDISGFNALGATDAARMTKYVDQQLNWAAIDDSALEARLDAAGYTTLDKSITQLWSGHVRDNPDYNVRMRPAWEVQRAALVRAVHSKRQLREMMVGFWHDHFNVTATDFSAGPVYPHFDRQLRLNAFGNFRALLESVAQSTSMMYYLDNRSNTRAGPNENFARELMELHTFGVENYLGFMNPFEVPPCPEDTAYPIGYTDVDVYETASAFTGWTIKDGSYPYQSDADGSFVYRQASHDAGPKFVLGLYLSPEQPALKDGRDILDRLASHPRVAQFICKKLIRRFVSDDPDPALVKSAAVIFRDNWRSSAQIKLTLRHILLSAQMRSAWGAKSRRPFEAIAATMRVLDCDWTLRVGHSKSDEFMYRMGFTGHAPYEWPAPNGYPDIAAAWSGANSFAMTWKMLGWLCDTTESGVPLSPIMATTRSKLPAAHWTGTQIVDFWCRRILGRLPDTARRNLLIDFMARNGNANTDVIADTDTWAATDLKKHYNQQRLKSMVSLILTSPEFFTR